MPKKKLVPPPRPGFLGHLRRIARALEKANELHAKDLALSKAFLVMSRRQFSGRDTKGNA